MKQRVTSEDIACLIPALNRILDSAYLVQVYDGSIDNTRTIIMKFRKKVDGNNITYYLLLESGIRVHTIDNFTSVRSGPSGCVGKIRKEFGDKRLFPIQQIGNDRSIDFLFSNEKHFIIELYDRGNFIITDNNYKILYITRPYEINEYHVIKNNIYPIDKIKDSGPIYEHDIANAKGYIVQNTRFSGFLFPFESKKGIEEYDNINTAMKKYFYKENNNPEIKVVKKSKKKKLKKDNRKINIENQIDKLNKKEMNALNNAINIENNIEEIQNIIDIINEEIKNKLSFNDIEDIIKNKFNNYKFIKINHKLLLIDNIEYDYNISAYANVSKLYLNKKVYRQKKIRAKDVGKNIKPIKQQDNKEKLIVNRKTMKFENYWWFIKDNYIIICGKSADDNESLLNNLEKNDILVHGNFDKSPWAIIKNPNKIEVPFKIIHYTGSFVVQRSWNWAENYGNNSYYTYPDKISKSTPSGEFMGKGSRMVYEKNFLPNTNMEMGVGVLFSCGDEYLHRLKHDTVIDFGMIMCAPYMAMNDFDYKVKVRPSGRKSDKGRKKLIESAIRKILATKNTHNLSKDYIRAIPFEEWDRICIRTFII
jgi:predicted ribosome quality control (RQC) complex YloA/Tae2 family protein